MNRVDSKKIHNTNDYSSGAIHTKNLGKMVDIWLKDPKIASLPADYKRAITDTFVEYSLQIPDEPFNKQKFELLYNDGSGSLFLISLLLSPHPTKENVLRWEKFILYADFEPAPPYVVITSSDCNLFNCDRTDEIVYLKAMVTEHHIRSIIGLSVNMLEGVMKTKMLTS